MFSNGGIFCMLSYLSPFLTKLSNVPLPLVSVIMLAMGICMVLFNLFSGKLCDRFSPGKVSTIWIVLSTLILICISLLGSIPYCAIPLVCLSGGMLFATSAPLQMLILRVSTGGQLLGASCIQAAFNLGNALGAFIGGLVFIFALNLHFIPLFGSIITFIGLICMYCFARFCEHKFSAEHPHTLPGNENFAENSKNAD